LMAIATLLAVVGATLAYVFYVRMPGLPVILSWRLRGLYELLRDKYRVDEFYDATVVRPYVALSGLLWKVVDQELIDGFVNGLAGMIVSNGLLWRRAQTGNVQHYALAFLGGVVLVLAYYVLR
jgi:NADH-quinone oxidoreductase subunit L